MPRLATLSLVLALAAGCGAREEPPAVDPQVAALVRALVEAADADTAEAAHDALVARGPEVVAPLAAELDRADLPDAKGAWIAEVLGSLGAAAEPAAPALTRRLMRGGGCSATTSWALGEIGPPAVAWLAKALGSEHAITRVWTSDKLADLGPLAAPAAAALRTALDDSESAVRANALIALGHLPGVDVPDDRLLALLADPADDVRDAAAEVALTRSRLDPQVAARVRRLVLEDPEDYTRGRVLQALDAQLGSTEADLAFLRAVVAQAGEHPDPADRAREMLVARGVDEAAVVDALADVDLDRDFDLLLERGGKLARGGPHARAACLPLLVRVLDWSPEREQRVQAAATLGGLGVVAAGDGPTMEALEVHADEKNDDPDVNAAVRAALARLREGR